VCSDLLRKAERALVRFSVSVMGDATHDHLPFLAMVVSGNYNGNDIHMTYAIDAVHKTSHPTSPHHPAQWYGVGVDVSGGVWWDAVV
jgi:hypothetical protein